MLRQRPLLLWLAASAALLRPALALEWKSTSSEMRLAPLQSNIEMVFEYTNTGAKPVTIRDVQANCGCLEAASDRTVVGPGETGRIRARFVVGDRYGLYERTISVVADDSPTPTHLRVKLDVPELASVTPRSLEWKRNAGAAEQVIDVRATAPLQIEFTEATPTNESFSARLETVEAGHVYRVHLKPASTAAPANAAIRIIGREKSGRAVLISAYADVQ